MKLNTTYPLNQLLYAVSNASENISAVVEEMKKEYTNSRSAVVRHHNVIVANKGYTQVTLCEDFNKSNQ